MQMGTPPVSVLIPYHRSDEWREQALAYVGRWWARHFPDWESILCGAEPWTKGAALANGALEATAPVLVIADADSFILDPADVVDAVARLEQGAAWVMPHRYVHRTSQAAAEKIYASGLVDIHDVAYPAYGGCEGGGMTVLPRAAWDRVGGIDPRFVGWGGEDRSFGWALSTLVGPCSRGNARLVHLWHPVQGPRQSLSKPTMALISRYRIAQRSRVRMAELVAEHQREEVAL
jgi:glycosyl transferase family 7 (putative galactosyltransferase)